MHEGAYVGYIQCKHRAYLAAGVAEHVFGEKLHRLRAGALGKTHRKDGFRKVQHVASLYAEGHIRGVVEGDLPGEIRMIAQYVAGVYGLPPAGLGVHLIKAYACAYGGEGIPGEVKVGYGLQREAPLPAHKVGKGAFAL